MKKPLRFPLGVRGEQIKPDESRIGLVDDGNLAWDERCIEARRQWPQADPQDFEQIGRRRWRDRASGITYRSARGAPLLDMFGDANRNIVTWFVSGGRITFLELDVMPEERVIYHGPVRGGVVEDGRVVWKS
jgi:hypothetical protein